MSKSQMPILLPCPFCGGEASMHGASYMSKKFPACKVCRAEHSSPELWNRRAESAAPQGEPASYEIINWQGDLTPAQSAQAVEWPEQFSDAVIAAGAEALNGEHIAATATVQRFIDAKRCCDAMRAAYIAERGGKP